MLYRNPSLIIIYLIFPIAWLHGFAVFNYNISSIQSIYFLSLTLVLVVLFFSGRIIDKPATAALTAVLFAYLASTTLNLSPAIGRPFDSLEAANWNIRFFTRSALITFLSYHLFLRIYKREVASLGLLYFSWIFITCAVLLHFFLGVGGVINNYGNLRDYYSSYFTSGNTTAYVYSAAALYLYLVWFEGRSWIIRFSLLGMTVLILILMDANSPPLLLLLTVGLFYFRPLSSAHAMNRVLKISVVALAIIFIILNIQPLLSLAIRAYSFLWMGDPSLLEWRLANFNPFTILISSRDIKLIDALSARSNVSVLEWLFGSSFALQHSSSFVESDFIDIFLSLGFFGLIIYLAVFFFAVSPLYKRQAYAEPHLIGFFKCFFLYTFLQAFATGHVLTSPDAGIVIGAVLASAKLCIKRNKKFC